MHNIKMIVTDIDGTILPYGETEFSDNTKKMFSDAKHKGIITVIASGREMVTIRDLLPQIENDVDYFIGANGSFVYDVKNKKYVIDNHIDHKDAFEFNLWSQSNFNDEGWTITDDQHIFRSENKIVPDSWFLKHHVSRLMPNKDFASKIKANLISLITITSSNQHYFDETVKWINENENRDLEINSRWSSGWFISRKNVNKLTAAIELSKLLNIDTSQVIAFGDSENDVEMIEGFNFGIAVKNANDHVKNVAHQIIDHVENDAVYHFLKSKKVI
ncbi:hypothetical protein EI74_0294 [Mycoplasma testudineum]|uniref:Cof subfamily protein (Haloacid dehalogenase superfamily)/HAD superfamily hydrolase (TIGR01484 family) n=1 Tax=Mycoplasma testudineum TaxID=244584 RepID=A0A4R6IFB1_9MOLU|nr:HAD family hydrolase [Mycoplasma testudineum]OYD26917.1 HAD family hydrolase [Mycoplasma testudineum]TDO20466.1 hypothetical protein EI74_0294 [Mycoplasma testudineum]